MNYFPAFFDLKDRPVLVVGGGAAAARKLRLLLKAGARVTVVAPRIGDEIAGTGAVVVRRGFVAGDLMGQTIAFAATGLAEVDGRVAEAARFAGVPVNVVDNAALSSFVVPAIVDRDPVVIGISTGGAAPVLASRLRDAIERLLPARFGRLAAFAEQFRSAVKATLPSGAARLRFWERFFDGPVADAVLAGDERGARERMLTLVNSRAAQETPGSVALGSVAIVGAGPGDPDLLTLRALRLIQRADVVIHDKLVGPGVLELVRRDADRIYVGKGKGHHSKSQDEINAIIAEQAQAGRRVVRLKGGDPFIFGRGGEELDYLRARGIAVELVPGITAALGCAAVAGIPLTHRDHAQAVTLATGQGKDGEPELDWGTLAKLKQTLVIYMGVGTAGRISAQLIRHGLDPATPVAVIENGTLPEQKAVYGRLSGLGWLVRQSDIAGPALIVIGRVAALADGATLRESARAVAV